MQIIECESDEFSGLTQGRLPQYMTPPSTYISNVVSAIATLTTPNIGAAWARGPVFPMNIMQNMSFFARPYTSTSVVESTPGTWERGTISEKELQVASLLNKYISSSNHSGVSWPKRDRKWTTCVWLGTQTKHLGAYTVKEIAAQAVDLKRVAMCAKGEQCSTKLDRLNFKERVEREAVVRATVYTEFHRDLHILVASLRQAGVTTDNHALLLWNIEKLRETKQSH